MVEQLDDTALNIYTDGSSFSGPRVGGIGYTLIGVDDDGHEVVYDDYLPATKGGPIGKMELEACMAALTTVIGKHPPADLPEELDIARYRKIVIRTDSMYVFENYENAKWQWPKNGWRTKDGPPVQNLNEWKELVKLAKKSPVRVEIKKVKGHSKDPHNRRVDKLARKSARSRATRSVEPQRVRRKLSPLPLQVGSVGMEGQMMTVRIITDKYFPPPHKCYRYMYEVMDEDSAYYQCVDYIWSDEMMSAGHVYFVQMNGNQKYPQIEEKLSEIRDEE